MNLALDGDGSLKIASFKKTEYRTEMEAYIEDFAVFLGIIAAEALRKRAGTEQGDAVHIPAAKEAAQDAEIQRVEQEQGDRYVVHDGAEQFALRTADDLCKRCQQISDAESRQRTYKAEDAELYVCHAFGINIDLNTKPHEIDLLKHAVHEGIQQMCALMNEIVGGDGRQNTNILSCSL